MRWWILVVAGALVGLLAGAYWLASGYEPLEAASVIPPDAEYEEGAEAHYVVWLFNNGRFSVRVTDINLESDGKPLLVRTEARLGDTMQDSEPFRQFTLEPDAVQPVVVVGRFDNCEQYVYGTKTRRDVQLVRYRVLGAVPAEQEVRLPRPIEVAAPPDEGCADRD